MSFNVKAIAQPSWWGWVAWAGALVLAPWVFQGGLGLTVLAQICIASVACLSFNMLWGQGGLMSFGHAVYTGAGAYAAVFMLRALAPSELPVPAVWVPLGAGFVAAGLAAALGWLTRSSSGMAFAMISLGLGELVVALVWALPKVFGGEAGVSANRVVGEPLLGWTGGAALQIYGLLVIYTLMCTAAMAALRCTPLGLMVQAVRDNAQRAQAVGYNAAQVRHRVQVLAGFFAGVAGGMHALQFEIATPELVSLARSGNYLLFTVLGGSALFAGPLIGAVLLVLCTVVLSQYTAAWQLHVGLLFMAVVLWAPGGVVSVWSRQIFGWLDRRCWRRVVAGAALWAGFTTLIEMIYHLQLGSARGPHLSWMGLNLDTHNLTHWGAALMLALVGVMAWRRAPSGERLP